MMESEKREKPGVPKRPENPRIPEKRNTPKEYFGYKMVDSLISTRFLAFVFGNFVVVFLAVLSIINSSAVKDVLMALSIGFFSTKAIEGGNYIVRSIRGKRQYPGQFDSEIEGIGDEG